jgi:hypothetical protein
MTKMQLSFNEAGSRLPSAGDGLAGAFRRRRRVYQRTSVMAEDLSDLEIAVLFAIYWRDMARI